MAPILADFLGMTWFTILCVAGGALGLGFVAWRFGWLKVPNK